MPYIIHSTVSCVLSNSSFGPFSSIMANSDQSSASIEPLLSSAFSLSHTDSSEKSQSTPKHLESSSSDTK